MKIQFDAREILKSLGDRAIIKFSKKVEWGCAIEESNPNQKNWERLRTLCLYTEQLRGIGRFKGTDNKASLNTLRWLTERLTPHNHNWNKSTSNAHAYPYACSEMDNFYG